ncbi:hypothetical protein BOW53_07030 [Solemya pervernicosa gill symbiont]|uniref:Pseudouridine synthase n=2 Tax=Gammaproteobacteria incertae sedis TaxID=118884 RepID=A0A1T2L691_9GAMM|nr:23S rRNA pseudouridine(2605) synthase RluB [Candidatus Reidiella endopervernicosa]OOZ40603.1 hypothetical protein BOW53_07030 [Solemya pervernicosa gill symbiont]QKQ26618.1 23S rRNA pseudouridine(2605) synthase RluB [Candidatus Reidiella endopervernicosa]
MAERLQKVLAAAGHGSRREIERWIEAGRISVNGVIAELGIKVGGHDKIRIDGRLIKLKSADAQPERRVIIYHKRTGEVTTTSDPEGRPTIFDGLPKLKGSRWINVGRLDINTSGLLLLTNDGELAHRLMHPSSEIDREYSVRVLGEVTPEMIKALQRGVELEDGRARFDKISEGRGDGANHWYHVVLKEGRNREVRRLWESQGVQVSRLTRTRFGPISLPRRLPRGAWRDLEDGELKQLLNAVSMQVEKPSPAPGQKQAHKSAKKHSSPYKKSRPSKK